MAFSVWEENDLFPVIYLKDEEGGYMAEIYSFGALLNAFSIHGPSGSHNVIDGFQNPLQAIENITAGFKSAKLSPFVCRITGGKYRFQEHAYSINKFYLGAEAIHGLLYDATFSVTEKGANARGAYAVLDYEYDKKDEGFPFKYHTEVTYSLKKGGQLSVTTAVTNTGDNKMPLSDGWHPYFALGGSINDLLLQINTGQMVEFNGRLVPTGNFLDYRGFSTPKLLGETFFDNCFVVKDVEKPACVIKNEANGLQLTISAVQGYPYLQVYTPPHRKSIAIENLSSVPDAFNNGIGLIIAKPLQPYIFAADYTLQFVHN